MGKRRLIVTAEDFYALVGRHCPGRAVRAESTLAGDLGLCSFDIMLISAQAEKEYGARFSFDGAAPATAGELYRRFL